jgi:hypothetical protein
MARFVGGRSEFLVKQSKKYKTLGLATISFFFVVLIIFILFSIIYSHNYGLVLIMCGLFLIFMIILDPLEEGLYLNAVKYHQGLKGEGAIFYELHSLHDSYAVFQNVYLPDRKWNIDFVVIGPTGIFTIEVKSEKGKVDFVGNNVTINGNPQISFIHEVSREFGDLHYYLKDQFNADIFINPLLVFSDKKVEVRLGIKPVIGNIRVIGKSWLTKAITEPPPYSYPIPKEQIEEKLLFLTKPPFKE